MIEADGWEKTEKNKVKFMSGKSARWPGNNFGCYFVVCKFPCVTKKYQL